jgi:DNA-binding transcriptional ArsR family regulator
MKNIDAADRERLLGMFKALANPVRYEIVEFLASHRGCITGDIVSFVPVAQATTSQHLKVLKESGIIQGEIEGAATKYCLDEKALHWFRERVGEIF